MAAVRGLVARARSGRLRGIDTAEATLTVTNLGDRGARTVYGVLVSPQVAIVRIGCVEVRPWVVDGDVVARPVVTLTLSGDHRVTSGHGGQPLLRRHRRDPERHGGTMSSIDSEQVEQVMRGLLADIAPEADVDGLAVDAPLQDTVDLDSVDFLNLVTAIWEATGVDIPERDYPQVATLRGCIDYITRHQATAPTI